MIISYPAAKLDKVTVASGMQIGVKYPLVYETLPFWKKILYDSFRKR
jgi:hypothetical protein